jgi:hypothetical protein
MFKHRTSIKRVSRIASKVEARKGVDGSNAVKTKEVGDKGDTPNHCGGLSFIGWKVVDGLRAFYCWPWMAACDNLGLRQHPL